MAGSDREVVMASILMRLAIAIVLTFGLAAALSQGAEAASDKRHHHATKTQLVKQPAEQYMRSAAPPDPEHQQR